MAGADVELPAMPRAAQQLALARQPVLAGLVGLARAPTITPVHSDAPACGHLLSSAKNSPLTLNTPMSRPFTVTSFLPPGAISPTVGHHVPRSCSAAVQRLGVVPEDLRPLLLACSLI